MLLTTLVLHRSMCIEIMIQKALLADKSGAYPGNCSAEGQKAPEYTSVVSSQGEQKYNLSRFVLPHQKKRR